MSTGGALDGMYWKDKVVVITGASAGLGRHIAGEMLEAGASIVIAARDVERLSATAAALSSSGRRVLAIGADVTRQDQVDDLFGRALGEFGRLDALVNCVGVSSRGRALETTPEEFLRALEINFLSVVRCTRAAAGQLAKSHGHLINIGSLASLAPVPGLSLYSSSKFAVRGNRPELSSSWTR